MSLRRKGLGKNQCFEEPELVRRDILLSIRIEIGNGVVQVRTRKGQTLHFSPLEFLTHLTVHIPDRSQHLRRSTGLYASATRRFLGLNTKAQLIRISEKPLTPRWATLLARIFGMLPVECPHGRLEMKLAGFVMHPAELFILVPHTCRAPPLTRRPSLLTW